MHKKIFQLTLLLSLALGISLSSCSQKPATGGKVSVDEFEQLLASNNQAQLIDVRTAEEFAGGHLKNAINISVNSGDFEQQVNALDKSKPVFVYCLSGGRASSAADFMRKNGFKTVYEMPGIMAWNSAGKELTTDTGTPQKAGMSMEDYQKLVTNSQYVLVDFNAVWCKPCKQLSPILEKIAQDKKDKLILIKVDADENATLLQQKHIEGIPYLELYKDGKLIWQHAGLINEQALLSETKL